MVVGVKLAKTVTADGLELDGLVAGDNSDVCVLHVHGKCGNFYQNSFVTVMAETYTRKGVSFASFNNRGHHCVAEAYSEAGLIYIGGSLENPVDCLLDIQAAIETARNLTGATSIILQGHSSGCEKVVFACANLSEPVTGAVLLSPADSRGLQADWERENPPKPIPAVSDAFVLSVSAYGVAGELGYSIPVSENSLALIKTTSLIDTFVANEIPGLPVRSVAYIGGADALQRPPGATWSAKYGVRGHRCRVFTIGNGDHHFRGYEDEVVAYLSDWVLSGESALPVANTASSIEEMVVEAQ